MFSTSTRMESLEENRKNSVGLLKIRLAPKFVALSDPCSRDMIIDPPDVDLAWGMSEKLFLRKKRIT